jgi:hypothetical protein
MSDRQFERAVTDWLEDGSDRTPERAIDGVLLAVKTTPQERDLRVPWRIPMPVYARAAVVAVALVVMVGAGFAFLNNRAPGGIGAAPTATPTAAPTDVAPGITGWTPYTSAIYGITLAYPDGWEVWPATRAAPAGGADDLETNDVFVSSEDDLGVGVRLRPAGAGADLASVEGLKAWAQTFCRETGAPDCDAVVDRVEPMCLNAGGDPCRAAILARSDGTDPAEVGELAFFPYWPSETFTGDPDTVVVVSVGRGDAFPGAAKYGGSVELLKSILSTMNVTSREEAGG